MVGDGLVTNSVNYDAVRRDIMQVMDSPSWDDGTYAPILIRLGWHSSGTYCKSDNTGGSNGATMRWEKEASDPENAGLDTARALLAPLVDKHPGLSLADLWILAAYCAIEHTGGPTIPFQGGRVDAPEAQAIAPGRLPGAETGCPAFPAMDTDSEGRILGWEGVAQHVRDVFYRMGFEDREIVALLCGGHVYGRCHPTSSGYNGAWVENPTQFSNEYAADMLGDEWILVAHDTVMPDGGPVPEEVRPAPGRRQYIDLTKYEEMGAPRSELAAPDASGYRPGAYECQSDWVNVRETPDVESTIVGRVNKGAAVSLVMVKVFGSAVRGLLLQGGWISVVGSGGKELFMRQGDLQPAAMSGRFRFLEAFRGHAKGQEVQADWVFTGLADHEKLVAMVGSEEVPLLTESGLLRMEKVVEGYNEKPRAPLKGQTGQQMMILTDMVLLWDPAFKPVLGEYAEDQELLSRDFGFAFKKLTELGCPWAASTGARGCPFHCSPLAGA